VRLKANSNNVSFEDNSYPNKNIVLAKGLRTSVTDNEVVFHKPGDTITDNSSPNQVKLPFGMDLINIGYTPAIPEDLNTFDLNKQTSGTDNSVFNYYRNTNISQIGVIVGTNDNSDIIFQIAKDIDYVRIGTLYYKWSGSVNIGGGQLTLYGKDGINIELNNWKRCALSSNDNNFNIKNNNNNKEITIPYGTDLNKTAFRQSIIDHTLINSPFNTLKETIGGGQYPTKMKTLVGENIYPKTTHTLLTAYYTSYIEILPQTTDNQHKRLLYYICTNTMYDAIQISAVNSTYYELPQLYIEIRGIYGGLHKSYTITASEPKVVIDLTAELAAIREGEEIIYCRFLPTGDLDTFYKDCVNILSNVFISYTYED
jgi:hypothetical protein